MGEPSQPQASTPATTAEPDPRPTSARGSPAPGSALRASLWTVGGFATGQVVRFLGNLVLTRLLMPNIFGLVALVMTFVLGLTLLSDLGLGPAVVQSELGEDRRFLDTVWTVQVIRGVVLFLASCAIGYPAAIFYEQPLLQWLIPAAGLGALLNGFSATSLFSAERHLQVKWLTLVDLTSQVLNILTIVLLATWHRRTYGSDQVGAVWAVIAGTLVAEATRTALSHWVLPGIRHRFSLDRASLQVIARFARWIFVSTMLYFFGSQADRLIFGKMIPLALLGVYGIAAALGSLPGQVILKLRGSVLFPVYSRALGRGDFATVYRRARIGVLLGGAAMVSGLLAGGPFLIRILYDRRYWEAGWILQVLAAAAWLQALESTNCAAFMAQGRLNWLAAGNAVKLVGMVALLPLGFWLGGFPGALVGLVASDVAKYLTSVLGIVTGRLGGLWLDFWLTAIVAAGSYAAHALGSGLAARYGSDLAGFGAVVGIWVLTWGLAGAWYWTRLAGLRRLAVGTTS